MQQMKLCNNDTATTSINNCQTETDSTTVDCDWRLPSSNFSDYTMSRVNAAEEEELSIHLQSASDLSQNVGTGIRMVEASADMTQSSAADDGFSQQGRISSSWQACVSAVDEVDTESMMTNVASASRPCVNTVTGFRAGRGRGLMNLRQLQSAKMASQGKGDGSAECSNGSADVTERAVIAPGIRLSENFADADVEAGVEVSSEVSLAQSPAVRSSSSDKRAAVNDGAAVVNEQQCLNASSDSQCDDKASAVHGDAVRPSTVQSSMTSSGHCLSTPPGLMPATGPPPLTSYHPHMMPYSWPMPAPMCGILPPGFASAALPVVGQTLPMPYSGLPVYPAAYGYPMMPSSWPLLLSSFSPLPADESNTDVNKVD